MLQSHAFVSSVTYAQFSPAVQNITRLVTVSLKITYKPTVTAGGLASDKKHSLMRLMSKQHCLSVSLDGCYVCIVFLKSPTGLL